MPAGRERLRGRAVAVQVGWFLLGAAVAILFVWLVALTVDRLAGTTDAVDVPGGLVGVTDGPQAPVAPETTAPTTSTTRAPRAPGEVLVKVLNGTNVAGLAGRTTARLAGLGYRTVPADDALEPRAVTIIWFAPGYEPEAAELSPTFPDADVAPYPNGEPPADLVVVLGGSFEE